MKKKVFVQKSIIIYCGLFLFLLIMGLSVYAIFLIISQGINSFLRWVYLFSAIGVFIFFAYTFIRFARNRIVLKSDEIFVPENWGSDKQKIQFDTHIKYEEICNIYLTISTNNSLNKKTKWIITPMPYIIFECDKDTQKAINVFYYSKKQVITILNEIVERVKRLNKNRLVRSGNEIFSEFMKSREK